MHELAVYILIVNAVWDFACAVAMAFVIMSERMNWLANMHFGLWSNVDDQDNPAALFLFAMLELEFAFMRYVTVLWDLPVLGAWSYFSEALLVFTAVMCGLIEPVTGWVVLTLCIVCCAFVVF